VGLAACPLSLLGARKMVDFVFGMLTVIIPIVVAYLVGVLTIEIEDE
jgi:t-SNARE complex subunit (syntaxin)